MNHQTNSTAKLRQGEKGSLVCVWGGMGGGGNGGNFLYMA